MAKVLGLEDRLQLIETFAAIIVLNQWRAFVLDHLKYGKKMNNIIWKLWMNVANNVSLKDKDFKKKWQN